MENNVPYIVHESSLARMERIVKKLVIAIIILIVALVITNAIWLHAWMQYDYVGEDTDTVTTYQQDGEGVNIIGNGNGVNNGSEEDSLEP